MRQTDREKLLQVKYGQLEEEWVELNKDLPMDVSGN